MDLVLTYVPASFKKATILPNSTQCLLAKYLVYWQHIDLSAILVKNEDKIDLIALKKIFRVDTWKKFT